MLRIAKTPEHMLNPVGGVIEQEEKTFLETIEFKAHQALAFGDHQFALRKISALIKPAIVESIVIFRHPERRKHPNLVREIFGVCSRRGHWKNRRCRIEIHG